MLGGRADKASEEQLLAWGEETCADFELQLFDGGHFFIHEQEATVLPCIERRLQRWRAGEGSLAPLAQAATF